MVWKTAKQTHYSHSLSLSPSLSLFLSLSIYIYIYACMYIYTYLYIYICVCVCIYIFVYIYIYIDGDRFLQKQLWFFQRVFSILGSSNINRSCYRRKNNDLIVLGDSEVTFLREKENVAFCPSLYCFFIYGVTKSKKLSNFLIFHIS